MLGIVFAGCNKGVEVEDLNHPILRVSMVTAEPMSFEVFLGNDFSRLLLPASDVFIRQVEVSTADSGALKIRIEQLPLKKEVANINYVPHLGSKQHHYLTIYQAKTGDMPFLVLPAGVSLPVLGSSRFQFVYNDASLPDSIHLRIYNGNATTAAADSCVMHKYQLSTWATLPVNSKSILQYDVRDAITGQVVVGRRNIPVGTSGISDDDFNIYQFGGENTGYSFLRLY